MEESDFDSLVNYLVRIPGIYGQIGVGSGKQGRWSLSFTIDIRHGLAWEVVQELAHVLNDLPADERLPTVFKPISPSPDENGGPDDVLSWVIECGDKKFNPGMCAKKLEEYLPDPVEDLELWLRDDD
ncbi:MAG: hypothetical protein KDI90_08700 [Alphaproteobacteria bacterium]|nr:hypothetical protein [Alphaproteobacteria bacterium]